jgi:hypothetical protein
MVFKRRNGYEKEFRFQKVVYDWFAHVHGIGHPGHTVLGRGGQAHRRFYDRRPHRNWYFLFGISHVFELSKMMSLKLAASAGYLLSTDEVTYPKFDSNATATTDKFSNFHDGTLSVSLPIKATDRITITTTLSYIFPLTGDAKDESRGKTYSGHFNTLPSFGLCLVERLFCPFKQGRKTSFASTGTTG